MDREGGGDASASNAIEHKAYARVGLLGNPSDVYYGKAVSFSLANFWASVKLEPSDDLVINPHPIHDLVLFRSMDHLVHALFSCLCSAALFLALHLVDLCLDFCLNTF